MSAIFELKVLGIKIQKDTYRTANGKTLGETVFWQSKENEATVLAFKRALARCQIKGCGVDELVELIISLRAGFVRVRVLNKRKGLDSQHLVSILRILLGNLYNMPDRPRGGVLAPRTSRDSFKYMLCTTYDPHWLVGTLHEVMDEKGMEFELTTSETNRLKDAISKIKK